MLKRFHVKAASLIILAAMLIASVSCGADNDVQTVDTTDTTATETTVPENTLYMPDDLPDELDYNGATVHTFAWEGDGGTEFFVEVQDGDIVNDAIYTRNQTVEERLNIKLKYTTEPGANAQRKEWVASVSNSVMAGEGAYDIAAGYSMCGASLASSRMLVDLMTLDYIDFNKPWWPDSLINEATCDGKLYFASGDISTNLINYMFGVFFNKSFISSYGLEDPYQLVRDGEWTLDKLAEMAGQVYTDVNGDGAKDAGDIFGFETHTVYTDAFYFGSGLRTTEIGDNGLQQISDDFKGEKTQALLEKLIGMFDTNSFYMSKDYEECRNIFSEERAMFFQIQVNYATTNLRDSEVDYGLIPVPKGSEEQEDYRTCMAFPYTLYGIPIDAKDPEMSAAVLECLASEGYRTVSPALFEIALKVKYASDDDASEMYDIIRDTVVFDFGRIFNDNLDLVTATQFRYSLRDRNSNWFSTYEALSSTLEGQFNDLIEALTEDIG